MVNNYVNPVDVSELLTIDGAQLIPIAFNDDGSLIGYVGPGGSASGSPSNAPITFHKIDFSTSPVTDTPEPSSSHLTFPWGAHIDNALFYNPMPFAIGENLTTSIIRTDWSLPNGLGTAFYAATPVPETFGSGTTQVIPLLIPQFDLFGVDNDTAYQYISNFVVAAVGTNIYINVTYLPGGNSSNPRRVRIYPYQVGRNFATPSASFEITGGSAQGLVISSAIGTSNGIAFSGSIDGTTIYGYIDPNARSYTVSATYPSDYPFTLTSTSVEQSFSYSFNSGDNLTSYSFTSNFAKVYTQPDPVYGHNTPLEQFTIKSPDAYGYLVAQVNGSYVGYRMSNNKWTRDASIADPPGGIYHALLNFWMSYDLSKLLIYYNDATGSYRAALWTLSTIPPALRLNQRDDGLGQTQGHARLPFGGNGPSSQQFTVARVDTFNTYT